jgi:hypothetical protein
MKNCEWCGVALSADYVKWCDRWWLCVQCKAISAVGDWGRWGAPNTPNKARLTLSRPPIGPKE